MRLPPRQEMRPASPALHAEKFHVPIKHIRILDLLDGTREIPQEHCHKPTRRQMSPKECEIVQPKSTRDEARFPCCNQCSPVFHIIHERWLDIL